ncbi:MAG: hypothetical protein JNN08_05010 [Bryobacterales bacterium]|nr:hypothetical protein [Bryobacterales bacterium]
MSRPATVEPNDRPEALIEEALPCKQAGYTAFKFRIGTEWKSSGMTLAKYIPWLRKLREAVGPDMDLMQESNMRLSLEPDSPKPGTSPAWPISKACPAARTTGTAASPPWPTPPSSLPSPTVSSLN